VILLVSTLQAKAQHVLHALLAYTQVAHIKGAQARKFLSTMEKKAAVPFSSIFPEAQPEALAMLHSLLVFDPQQRATAAQALQSPYLTPFQDEPFEAPAPPAQLSFEFERSGALLYLNARVFVHCCSGSAYTDAESS
jgi:serine/threonine protein kinase